MGASKLFPIVLLGAGLTFSLPIDESLKAFTDGYLQGFEDGYRAGVMKVEDYCHYIDGAKIFDDLLINGVIPPPKIEARWKLVSDKNGLTYKRELEVKFKPVNMEELMQYKQFADFLTQIANERERYLPSGYFYVVVKNPLPKPYKGLLEYIVKKYISDDAIVGVEEDEKFYLAKAKTLEDAKFIQHRLEQILGKMKDRLKVSLEIERL